MFPKFYAAAFGLWAVAGDSVGDLGPMIDRIGFGALTVALVYWITAKLSQQMDEQRRAIERLTESIQSLARESEAAHGACRRVNKGGMEGK